MWLKRKIKNSKSWNCFQEKNVKGKLIVAQKAEAQAEKRTNHQKVLSDLLRPLSAWWGAESSAESGSDWQPGCGRRAELRLKSVEGKWVFSPAWTGENWGFALKKTLFFWGKRKEWKGHPLKHVSKTEVAVK